MTHIPDHEGEEEPLRKIMLPIAHSHWPEVVARGGFENGVAECRERLSITGSMVVCSMVISKTYTEYSMSGPIEISGNIESGRPFNTCVSATMNRERAEWRRTTGPTR